MRRALNSTEKYNQQNQLYCRNRPQNKTMNSKDYNNSPVQHCCKWPILVIQFLENECHFTVEISWFTGCHRLKLIELEKYQSANWRDTKIILFTDVGLIEVDKYCNPAVCLWMKNKRFQRILRIQGIYLNHHGIEICQRVPILSRKMILK
jgi:hypothetical protein